MGRKVGALLWNRMRIALGAGTTSIDTGITQRNRSFNDYSLGEPSLGVSTAPPGPPNGTPPASRIQIVPLAPVAAWLSVSHGEPFVNPATDTVWVSFAAVAPVTINVLFWDLHSIVGPGQADLYTDPIEDCPRPTQGNSSNDSSQGGD